MKKKLALIILLGVILFSYTKALAGTRLPALAGI